MSGLASCPQSLLERVTALRIKHLTMYLMLLPAVILVAVFHIIPFINGMRISFTNWDGFSQSFNYVGFQNYVDMWNDHIFYISVRNTLIYGFCCTTHSKCAGSGLCIVRASKIYVELCRSFVRLLTVDHRRHNYGVHDLQPGSI